MTRYFQPTYLHHGLYGERTLEGGCTPPRVTNYSQLRWFLHFAQSSALQMRGPCKYTVPLFKRTVPAERTRQLRSAVGLSSLQRTATEPDLCDWPFPIVASPTDQFRLPSIPFNTLCFPLPLCQESADRTPGWRKLPHFHSKTLTNRHEDSRRCHGSCTRRIGGNDSQSAAAPSTGGSEFTGRWYHSESLRPGDKELRGDHPTRVDQQGGATRTPTNPVAEASSAVERQCKSTTKADPTIPSRPGVLRRR
jgi:hypothetical protein